MGCPRIAIEPRSVLLNSKNMPKGTYSLVVETIDQGRSRLIARDRARWRRFDWTFAATVYQRLRAYMQTGLIQGVRDRAEQGFASGAGESSTAAPGRARPVSED
jgi:DNA-binding GntR family transcriptional regulator